jgi:multidrug resistance efflux pump
MWLLGSMFVDTTNSWPAAPAIGNAKKMVQRLPVKIALEPGKNKDQRLRPGLNIVPESK